MPWEFLRKIGQTGKDKKRNQKQTRNCSGSHSRDPAVCISSGSGKRTACKRNTGEIFLVPEWRISVRFLYVCQEYRIPDSGSMHASGGSGSAFDPKQTTCKIQNIPPAVYLRCICDSFYPVLGG